MSALLRPDRFLLAFGLFIGTILCFAIPPFMVADEGAHFFRAYEVSEHHFVSIKSPVDVRCGNYLPASLTQTIREQMGDMPFHPDVKFDFKRYWAAWHEPLEPTVRVFSNYVNTALYSPLPYAPQAFGIAVGRHLGLPPIGLMYSGRLANLLVSMLLLSTAVRWVPAQKWSMVLCVLLPLCLYECASLAADGMTIALSFLFVALVWRITAIPWLRADAGQVLLLILIGAALSLSKTAYAPILALALIIPVHKFRSGWSSKLLALILIAGVSLMGVAIWGWLVKDLYTPGVAGADPHAQIALLAKEPQVFWRALQYALQQRWTGYFKDMLGSWMGWLDVHLPFTYLRPLVLGIIFFAFVDPTAEASLPILARLFSAALAMLILAFVALLMYISWNKVGATDIEGIAGRYLLPLPVLVLPLFAHSWVGRVNPIRKIVPVAAVACALYAGLFPLAFIIPRYYF